MAVLPEDLDLSSLTSLVRTVNATVVDVGEGLSPGVGGAGTLTGNIIGEIGVVEDVLDNVDEGSLSGALTDVHKDAFGPGGIINNLFDGKGLGTEALTTDVVQTIGGVPLVHEGVQALSPVASLIDQVNNAVVDVAEGLSPGSSHAGTLTGNIIGKIGIVEDVTDNIHEGDLPGLVLDVYKDVLGPGGILHNAGDGEGSGLESLVHQLGDSDILPLDAAAPVLEPVASLVESVNDTVVGLTEGLAPGSSEPGTLTGNLIGELGVVEDIVSNLKDGSLTGAISDVHDDVFASGGILHNLADGEGSGLEGLLGGTGGILDGLPILGGGGDGGLGGILDGLPIVGGGGDGGLLGGILDGLPIVGGGGDGGLLGGVLDGLPIVGGGSGDGLLGGVLDGLPIVGGGSGDGGLLGGILGDTLGGSGDSGGAANLLSDTLDQVGALLGGGDDAGGGLPLLGGGLDALPVVGGLLAGLDLGLSFDGHADV